SLNFAHFHVSIPEGVGLRLIMDIAAVLMTLALLSWLTDRNGLIAKIGKHSLAIYVLHGFVVRGLQPVLDGSRDVLPDAIVFLICLALAVAWTGVLSWTPFELALRWYASTASRLIRKPCAAPWSRIGWAAWSPADSQGGPDAPAASGALGGLCGSNGPEGPGDVDRFGDRHGEYAHPFAHDLA